MTGKVLEEGRVLVTEVLKKVNILKEIISGYKSVLVAFSGGVDSTLLLKVAHDVLGERVLAVTAVSEIYPPGEGEGASALARLIGCKHLVFEARGLESPAFAGNPPDRCYHCKKEIYAELLKVARERGLNYVVDGANADDAGDYRPGLRAGKEMGIKSPLLEAGLTKEEIRALSRELGLPTADKPANPCLASRFPYGTTITREGLKQVAEAEKALQEMGFTVVRVRHHANLARIEVSPGSMPAVLEKSRSIVQKLREIGYAYVTLDLQGYRTGSMNETLEI